MAVDTPTREREEALLRQAIGGDRTAYGDLLILHQPRALALATGIVGNREDALDLVQEACFKSYRALKSFIPGRPFFPWFYRILRNACIQHLRSRRVRRSVPLLRQVVGESHVIEPEDRSAMLPEDIVARDENSKRVGDALVRLASADAEILMLKHFDGLSYKEIAASLSIPVGTVMSRLHAARRRLRKLVPESA